MLACSAIVFSSARVQVKSNAKQTRPIAHNNIPKGQEGYIHLDKTVTTTTMKDVWKVQLSVAGVQDDLPAPADIVLTIDTSGSMGSGANSKMELAKAATKVFVESMWDINRKESDGSPMDANKLKRFNSRFKIGALMFSYINDVDDLMGFGSPFAITNSGLNNYTISNRSTMLSNIDQITARGGTTPTARALNESAKVLLSSQNRQIILLLSDGGPGNSLSIGSTTAFGTTLARLPVNKVAVNNQGVLETTSMANEVRDNGMFIYPISVDLSRSTAAERMMRTLAFDYDVNKDASGANAFGINDDPASYFNTQDYPTYTQKETALKAHFKQIAEKLAVVVPSYAYVYDQISDPFELYTMNDSPYPAQVEYSYWQSRNIKNVPTNDDTRTLPDGTVVPLGDFLKYNEKESEFLWRINNFADESDPDTLTYYVKLKKGYTLPIGTPIGTNDMAYIDYVNVKGEQAVKFFPSPVITLDDSFIPTTTPEESSNEGNFIEVGYVPAKPSEGFAINSEGWAKQSEKEEQEKQAKEAAKVRVEQQRELDEIAEIELAEKSAQKAQFEADKAQTKADEAKKALADAKKSGTKSSSEIKRLEKAAKEADVKAKVAKEKAKKAKEKAENKKALAKQKKAIVPTPSPSPEPING